MKQRKNHTTNQARLRDNQSGLVAIFVVMIIMILLTLIVLGFARVVNREQRQTLDRQLNSQALYAAESGVNDAVHALSLPANSALLTQDHTECTGSNSFISRANQNMSPGLNSVVNGNISYSCLLVDPTPETLVFNGATKGTSQVTPIRPEASADSIQVVWRSPVPVAEHSGCPESSSVEDSSSNYFPSVPSEQCDYAVMRLELVNFNGPVDRNSLSFDGRSIFFAQPSNASAAGSSRNFGSGSNNAQGQRVPATCTSSNSLGRFCSMTITGLAGFSGYLRMTPIYFDANIEVSALDGGNKVGLAGAQVEIDVTGLASDVVKRIRVFRSIDGGVNDGVILPEFALQSKETQCKKFSIRPGVFSVEGPSPACGL